MASNATTGSPKATEKPKGGLTAKDILLDAVFGLVTFAIAMAIAMVFSFNTNLAWWTHAVAAIPCGIVWMYLMARVPKKGSALIAGCVMALLGMLMGMAWTGPLGMAIGAVLCEAIMVIGKRSKWSMAIGFAVFMLCWWFGMQALILFSGADYVQMVVEMGMTEEYGWGLVNWTQSPMFYVCGIVTFICGLFGSLLGFRVFKKHFAKLQG